MKKYLKLIPALCLLLVSAILMGTSTFAWFSMNTRVTATNMQVQAIADQGILINEVADATDTNWDNSVNTATATTIKLHATSTANTSTWYVAYSKSQDDSAAASSGTPSNNLTIDGYKVLGTDIMTATETVNAVAGSTAQRDILYVDKDNDSTYDENEGYYVKYTYYIKSSADAITLTPTTTGQSFNIKSVTATTLTSNSVNLDKALRVAIVVANKAYIYAPVYDYANSETAADYYVNASTTATTPLDNTVSYATALTSIPATTDNGTPLYVYMYFEGEDTNLKTSNVVATLDNVKIDIEFELTTNTTTPAQVGVAIS